MGSGCQLKAEEPALAEDGVVTEEEAEADGVDEADGVGTEAAPLGVAGSLLLLSLVFTRESVKKERKKQNNTNKKKDQNKCGASRRW